MFGLIPAYGFFIRHARNIELQDINLGYLSEDQRPAFVLDDVAGVELTDCTIERPQNARALVMMKARRVSAFHCTGLADFQADAEARAER